MKSEGKNLWIFAVNHFQATIFSRLHAEFSFTDSGMFFVIWVSKRSPSLKEFCWSRFQSLKTRKCFRLKCLLNMTSRDTDVLKIGPKESHNIIPFVVIWVHWQGAASKNLKMKIYQIWGHLMNETPEEGTKTVWEAIRKVRNQKILSINN